MNTQFPKCEITDYEVLEEISVEQMNKYLVQKKWKSTGNFGFASVWESPDGTVGVIIPRTKEVVDYTYRVSDLLKTLAKVEKRCQQSWLAAYGSQMNIWVDLTGL